MPNRSSERLHVHHYINISSIFRISFFEGFGSWISHSMRHWISCEGLSSTSNYYIPWERLVLVRVWGACFLQSIGSKWVVASSLNLLLHTNHSTASAQPYLIPQRQNLQQPALHFTHVNIERVIESLGKTEICKSLIHLSCFKQLSACYNFLTTKRREKGPFNCYLIFNRLSRTIGSTI